MKLTFRIDDISLNTDADRLASILQLIKDKFPQAKILLAVSPVVFDMKEYPGLTSERPFPAILNAHSDWRVFLAGNRAGIPHWLPGMLDINVELASHGLVHVDHRLLSLEAQEISILTSRSIVGSAIFVPPFNKWDSGIEEICQRNSIKLIKWEDGWHHLAYQPFEPSVSGLYYFHTHDFNLETLKLKLGP